MVIAFAFLSIIFIILVGEDGHSEEARCRPRVLSLRSFSGEHKYATLQYAWIYYLGSFVDRWVDDQNDPKEGIESWLQPWTTCVMEPCMSQDLNMRLM